MTYDTNTQYTSRQEQIGLGELLTTLSNQLNQLFRQEVQLAQAEMARKATRAGQNAALIVIGAVLANAALLAVVAAIILGLAQFMNAWLAAVLVGIVLSVIAGLLIQSGIKKLKTIDPAPRRTIETMKENKEWLARQI